MNTNINNKEHTWAPVHEEPKATQHTQQHPDELVTKHQVKSAGPRSFATQHSRNNFRESSLPLNPIKTHEESNKRPKYNTSTMCLKGIGLHGLHKIIENNPALSVLDISSNGLRSLPDSIGSLSKLRRLDLKGNKLTSLPDSIGNLVELEWIDLSFNYELKSLPSTLSKCTKLCFIDISECNYKKFPEVLTSLPQLQHVECYNNEIKTIPMEIYRLKSLVKFNLSGNAINELPRTFCELTSLSWLNLNGNHLICLPISFGDLTQLIELDLSKNKLVSLGESIGELSSLKHLYIPHNNLTQLPTSLFNTTSLEVLNASSNQLQTLPELLDNKYRIPKMDFRDNQLRYIPFWCVPSKSVEVEISGNPWLLPEELPTPNYIFKTPEQTTLAHLLQDSRPHSTLFLSLPRMVRQKLSIQVKECERCHRPFCGAPASVVEFRSLLNGMRIPTVLRVCGSDCISKIQTESTQMRLWAET